MTYLRFDAASLPGQVGQDGPNGSRISDNRGGFISYGPYFSGDPGIYVAGFSVRRTGEPASEPLIMDVWAAGKQEFARRSVSHSDLFDDIATLVYVEFEVREPTDSIEVRLFVEASAAVEVQSLVIFRKPPRTWGSI